MCSNTYYIVLTNIPLTKYTVYTSFYSGEMALEILAQEKVWLDKSKYADAERLYFEKCSKVI